MTTSFNLVQSNNEIGTHMIDLKRTCTSMLAREAYIHMTPTWPLDIMQSVDSMPWKIDRNQYVNYFVHSQRKDRNAAMPHWQAGEDYI